MEREREGEGKSRRETKQREEIGRREQRGKIKRIEQRKKAERGESRGRRMEERPTYQSVIRTKGRVVGIEVESSPLPCSESLILTLSLVQNPFSFAFFSYLFSLFRCLNTNLARIPQNPDVSLRILHESYLFFTFLSSRCVPSANL